MNVTLQARFDSSDRADTAAYRLQRSDVSPLRLTVRQYHKDEERSIPIAPYALATEMTKTSDIGYQDYGGEGNLCPPHLVYAGLMGEKEAVASRTDCLLEAVISEREIKTAERIFRNCGGRNIRIL